MKYHTTESRWYDQTVAEVWFTHRGRRGRGLWPPDADEADDDAVQRQGLTPDRLNGQGVR